ncbi:MAG: hypothetical protein U0514_04070 [Candidatus Andersenbacteria bacterium]
MKIDQLSVGTVIDINGALYVVLSSDFMKTAQRRPVMRTKLRNVINGAVLEKTFSRATRLRRLTWLVHSRSTSTKMRPSSSLWTRRATNSSRS